MEETNQPKLCLNCYQYGHNTKNCTIDSKERACLNCCSTEHDIKNCKEKPKCLNCGKDHKTYSFVCINYKKALKDKRQDRIIFLTNQMTPIPPNDTYNSGSNKTIRLVQINIDRKYIAHDLLRQFNFENDIHIVLGQEPTHKPKENLLYDLNNDCFMWISKSLNLIKHL